MSVPTNQKLRSGRIYNVAEAQMWWQPGGKRLAVYTKRYSKKQTKADTGEIKYIVSLHYLFLHPRIFRADALIILKFLRLIRRMFL